MATTDKNVVFLGDKEIEDLFEDHTLAAAFKRYFVNDVGGEFEDEQEVETIISRARNHTDGLCKGLRKEVYERTETTLSKTSFCEHLLDVIREDSDQHPIPGEIQRAFNLLEEYVDPER